MKQHNNTQWGRGDASSKLKSGHIRSWCEVWDFHPDVRDWLLEAYAKGQNDGVIIDLLHQGARARMTYMKNSQRMWNRKRIEWRTGRPPYQSSVRIA